MRLYWDENPQYDETVFRRRYRLPKPLLERIMSDVSEIDDYFNQKRSRNGKMGMHPLLKFTAALRKLSIGCSSDLLEEMLDISRAVVDESLTKFCSAIIELYGPEYLRKPTEEDVRRIAAKYASLGWPGLLGSLDCMHYEWRAAPKGWQGQFRGKEHLSYIILEAVCDSDSYIWHAQLVTLGSMYDLNVLQRCSLCN